MAGNVLCKVLRQDGNVVLPVAQGRQGDADDVQTVVKVVPEQLVFDHFLYVLVRRGDYAHVHGLGLVGAYPLHRALLYEAEQAHLHRERHVSDLVEEDRAVVGVFKLAHAPLAVGSGEGALLIAEKLALQQALRYVAAVYGHEVSAPPAEVVYGPCHYLLARAGFPLYENVGRVFGYPAYHMVDLRPLHAHADIFNVHRGGWEGSVWRRAPWR